MHERIGFAEAATAGGDEARAATPRPRTPPVSHPRLLSCSHWRRSTAARREICVNISGKYIKASKFARLRATVRQAGILFLKAPIARCRTRRQHMNCRLSVSAVQGHHGEGSGVGEGFGIRVSG